MDNSISSIQELESISPDKLKAAYALNMCTVSVSQIIDYNDVYVLEQEYDAILNNLNLEEIPKDEALLKTLTEILNTITFFRIQEVKKTQLDKEYQQRVKNAIWSAVPNLSVVVSGNPIAIAMALATQVGTGYMNYRKEKKNALSDKEKSEVELQITAIEQFNALRRELFTTAWRLADKYGFPDCLRLTEKQIKQYNSILLDQDEYRKYARLEAIQSKFLAYPPFWYFFAHTALYIATSTDDAEVRENYLQKARSHFEQHQAINKFSILREDQLTASADLEYVDLLLLDATPHYDRICDIIADAAEKAGNANDVLQLCALAYLRAGKTDVATRLFKILVNEEYNTVANARILSRLYVSQYISSGDREAYSNYRVLETRTDPIYLFPMPAQVSGDNQDKLLEDSFISKQKSILKKEFRNSLDAFAKQNIIEFNSVLSTPVKTSENRETYYSYTIQAKEQRMSDAKKALSDTRSADYVNKLRERGFKYGFVDVLNSTVAGFEELSCFRSLDTHDRLIQIIEKKLRNAKVALDNLQKKMNDGSFAFDDYQKLVDDYSYQAFTEAFFSKTKDGIMLAIDATSDLKAIEEFDHDLEEFCKNHHLPAPDQYIHTFKGSARKSDNHLNERFFNYELLGETSDWSIDIESIRTSMMESIRKSISDIVINSAKVSVYIRDNKQFETYLENDNLIVPDGSVYLLRQKAIVIIDDKTKRDRDLILCVDGIRLVSKNTVRGCVKYCDVVYVNSGDTAVLNLGYPDVYSNKDVKIDILKGIIGELDAIARCHGI